MDTGIEGSDIQLYIPPYVHFREVPLSNMTWSQMCGGFLFLKKLSTQPCSPTSASEWNQVFKCRRREGYSFNPPTRTFMNSLSIRSPSINQKGLRNSAELAKPISLPKLLSFFSEYGNGCRILKQMSQQRESLLAGHIVLLAASLSYRNLQCIPNRIGTSPHNQDVVLGTG
jgi:hypothetical protein